MPELSIPISEELKQESSKLPKPALTKIFEKALRSELEERSERQLILSAVNKILENSKFTDEDCLRLGREVNEGMYEQLKKEGLL
tara:strand:+ start:131 stop:385 length:255 start_codon:yes stop_codon:yes gene_type:complete